MRSVQNSDVSWFKMCHKRNTQSFNFIEFRLLETAFLVKRKLTICISIDSRFIELLLICIRGWLPGPDFESSFYLVCSRRYTAKLGSSPVWSVSVLTLDDTWGNRCVTADLQPRNQKTLTCHRILRSVLKRLTVSAAVLELLQVFWILMNPV